MATKHQVIALHKEHPDWNSEEIASELDCDGGYVRATFKRNGLRLPAPLGYQAPEQLRKRARRLMALADEREAMRRSE